MFANEKNMFKERKSLGTKSKSKAPEKVTVKKKFVEDALYNSTSIRVASVYVIVINREKAYDPLVN